MNTDTTERGLESLICTSLAGDPNVATHSGDSGDRPATYSAGWLHGDPHDYDREYCVDLNHLSTFLGLTQPVVAQALDLGQDPTRPACAAAAAGRRKFLARLQGEIAKRGTIDVLRRGIKHGRHQIDSFYGAPSPGNEKARARYEHNRFSVTRQLQYSRDNTRLALDLCLFINGLPVATFELKNSLTKQTVEDAIEQYKRDRSPAEKLFEFGPVPTGVGTGKPEPEIDRLSNILRMFNELFGNIDWKDGDKIGRGIAEELPAKVAADKAYRNAMENSDRQNARIEHDKALERAVTELLSDHADLFKQFSDNESFRKWLSETNFRTTYRQTANV